MIKLNRQILLVCSLVLLLLGSQVVQSSSVHDHSQHQVDCVLCHYDSHDQAVATQADANLFQAQTTAQTVWAEPEYYSYTYPAYQGRSSPNSYS